MRMRAQGNSLPGRTCTSAFSAEPCLSCTRRGVARRVAQRKSAENSKQATATSRARRGVTSAAVPLPAWRTENSPCRLLQRSARLAARGVRHGELQRRWRYSVYGATGLQRAARIALQRCEEARFRAIARYERTTCSQDFASVCSGRWWEEVYTLPNLQPVQKSQNTSLKKYYKNQKYFEPLFVQDYSIKENFFDKSLQA